MNVKRLYTPWKIELFYRVKSFLKQKRRCILDPPKKILLCNQGALGDVFLTTCMISPLKKAFSDCHIGMLVAPQSRVAVQGCPGIDTIHELEPWFHLHDSKWTKLRKRLQFRAPEYDYDWVICTFPFYRGVGSSFHNIPNRICFETLGDRIHFNHVIPWEPGYIGEQYERLLKEVGVENPQLQCPWELSNRAEDYVLFHMGSADAAKEFSLSFWQDLYDVYQAEGRKVFFTGSGERQEKLIQKIAPQEYNYCNRLSFPEFLQKVARADHIVSVDTVTVHVAAMLRKRYYALFQKPLDVPLWFPNTEEGACIL
ncbi:MAG: hypothetical protein K940chlam6_00876 [Chlamydiae bacterium]|nr:hypothetical protein [Chlamydiota bacterium]